MGFPTSIVVLKRGVGWDWHFILKLKLKLMKIGVFQELSLWTHPKA